MGLSGLVIFSVFLMWLSLILNPSCFFVFFSFSSSCFQISPLRPQRPKSQVLNVLGDKRLSVSPGPAVPQTTSTLPPPITPRVKLTFSMLSSSSKLHLSSSVFISFTQVARINLATLISSIAMCSTSLLP